MSEEPGSLVYRSEANPTGLSLARCLGLPPRIASAVGYLGCHSLCIDLVSLVLPRVHEGFLDGRFYDMIGHFCSAFYAVSARLP